ncbi:biopolymer transporter ExbB, partial [Xanthomonas perforans]
MLQEFFIAAAAGGSNPSAALSQMGFEHLITEMTSSPGDFAVSWVVLITLIAMSAASWYWTVINIFRATRLKSAADRVTTAFWDAPNAQDAIRAMEEQPASEPFSKIALDAAQA